MASFLLAIARDRTVTEVPLEAKTSAELSDQFDELEAQYLADKEIVSYEPGYAPPQNELMSLEYDLPEPLASIKRVLPSGIGAFDGTLRVAPAALVSVKAGNSPTLRFQALGKQNVLKPHGALLFGPKHFKFNTDAALIPAQRIDAIYQGGNLLFKSEHQVRRFLDLERYFKESTDQEIDSFFDSDTFFVADMNALKAIAGTVVRRKIARLIDEGFVFNSAAVKAGAHKAGVALKFKGGKLVIPDTRSGLRETIDLLSHAYVGSLIDPQRLYYASSKRPIKPSS